MDNFERVEIGNATLYCGDAFDILPTLGDGTIDQVISDPPYASQTFGKCVDCEWDAPINLHELWRLLESKAKPQANLCLFCNMRFGFDLIGSNPKAFRYDMIWAKNNRTGFLNASMRPMISHELLTVWCRPGFSKMATYNTVKTAGGRPRINRSKARQGGGVYPAGKAYTTVSNGDVNPISVLAFDHDRGNGLNGFHPTQKPLNLLGYLLMLYSNPNDLVLDMFMGSGTTGLAAIKLNRKFIGIERERKYFDIACRRLEEAQRRKERYKPRIAESDDPNELEAAAEEQFVPAITAAEPAIPLELAAEQQKCEATNLQENLT